MKFKSFINEAERVTIISDKDVQRLLKTEYSAAVKQWKSGPGHRIYRGRPGNENFFLGDSTVGERKSANTRNYYTLWIDNSPEWNAYPKRSKSFICTSDWRDADYYGNTYIVLPQNGTKIASCPAPDFWDSFKTKFKDINVDVTDLSDLNERLFNILSIHADNSTYISDKSYSELQTQIRRVDKLLSTLMPLYEKNSAKYKTLADTNKFIKQLNSKEIYADTAAVIFFRPQYTNFLMTIFKKYGPNNTIENFMDDLFKPKNIFKLVTIEKYSTEKSCEVWFSGTALFIKESYAEKLLKDIR